MRLLKITYRLTGDLSSVKNAYTIIAGDVRKPEEMNKPDWVVGVRHVDVDNPIDRKIFDDAINKHYQDAKRFYREIYRVKNGDEPRKSYQVMRLSRADKVYATAMRTGVKAIKTRRTTAINNYEQMLMF